MIRFLNACSWGQPSLLVDTFPTPDPPRRVFGAAASHRRCPDALPSPHPQGDPLAPYPPTKVEQMQQTAKEHQSLQRLSERERRAIRRREAKVGLTLPNRTVPVGFTWCLMGMGPII